MRIRVGGGITGIIMIAKVGLSFFRKMNFSSFFGGRERISALLNYAKVSRRSDFYFVKITAFRKTGSPKILNIVSLI